MLFFTCPIKARFALVPVGLRLCGNHLLRYTKTVLRLKWTVQHCWSNQTMSSLGYEFLEVQVFFWPKHNIHHTAGDFYAWMKRNTSTNSVHPRLLAESWSVSGSLKHLFKKVLCLSRSLLGGCGHDQKGGFLHSDGTGHLPARLTTHTTHALYFLSDL